MTFPQSRGFIYLYVLGSFSDRLSPYARKDNPCQHKAIFGLMIDLSNFRRHSIQPLRYSPNTCSCISGPWMLPLRRCATLHKLLNLPKTVSSVVKKRMSPIGSYVKELSNCKPFLRTKCYSCFQQVLCGTWRGASSSIDTCYKDCGVGHNRRLVYRVVPQGCN